MAADDDNADVDAASAGRSLRGRLGEWLRPARRASGPVLARARSSLRSNGFVGGMAVGLVFLLIPLVHNSLQDASAPLMYASAQVSWDEDLDGATWVFQKELRPDQVRRIQSVDWLAVDRLDDIARSYGGVRVSESGFSLRTRIVLRGAREEPTLIEGMKAEKVDCVPAPTGALVRGSLQGGGEIQSLAVDLDAGSHEAKAVLADGSLDDRPYFSKHFHQLNKGESVVYEVLATTRQQCGWRLAIQVRSGETTGTVNVDDVGESFLASSVHYEDSKQNRPYRTCLISDNDTGYINKGFGCRG